MSLGARAVLRPLLNVLMGPESYYAKVPCLAVIGRVLFVNNLIGVDRLIQLEGVNLVSSLVFICFVFKKKSFVSQLVKLCTGKCNAWQHQFF